MDTACDSDIPTIWRNRSLKRKLPPRDSAIEMMETAAATIVNDPATAPAPATVSAPVPAPTQHRTSRFSEDFNALLDERLPVHIVAPAGATRVCFVNNGAGNGESEYSPPRPPTPGVERPPSPPDTSHEVEAPYPRYLKQQERALLIEQLSICKGELERIRGDYEKPFRLLFGPCGRCRMHQYRAFLGAVAEVQKWLNRLLDLLSTADDHPDCVPDDVENLVTALDRWTEDIDAHYDGMTGGQGRKCVEEGMFWKTKSLRRAAFGEAGPMLVELAKESRALVERRVKDIVNLLLESRKYEVDEVPAGRPLYAT